MEQVKKEKRVSKHVIKTLSMSVREFKTASILSPVFVFIEVVLECLLPFVMSALIDDLGIMDTARLLIYTAILIGMALLSLLFGVLSGKAAAKASAGFAKNLRMDLFSAIQTYSFKNIDKYSVAGLVTRLTTDITNVQNSFMMIIRIAVRAPFMLVFSFVLAFILNSSVAWVFLVALPIFAAMFFIVLYNVKAVFEKIFRRYDDLNESAQENISGIRVVKSFVREDDEIAKFTDVSLKIRKDFIYVDRVMSLAQPVMMFCMYLVNILIAVIGGMLIINSGGVDMTTGQLTSMITYAAQTLSSLMMFAMVIVMIFMSRASASRIVDALHEKSDIVNAEGAVTEVPDGTIDFENVSFKYSEAAERNALSNVNLHINSGETVGILGGTGSSKSTLVNLIPRLYDVTEGSVKVGGRDVRDYDIVALRDSVAMVLQKNILFSGSIKENLRWGNENATDEELIHASKLAQADGFVSSFPQGYDTHIEQGGSNVSGGQKQRLCIARALLKKPKILILDDSTSAVDTKTDALIQKAFATEIPDTTKIIISQRVSSIQHADKIIVISGGMIEAVGTHEELLKSNKTYDEFYHMQNKEAE